MKEQLGDFLAKAGEIAVQVWNWSMTLPDLGCVIFIGLALVLAITFRGKLAKVLVCVPALILLCQHVVPLVLKK